MRSSIRTRSASDGRFSFTGVNRRPALALGVRMGLAAIACLIAGCPPPQQKTESFSRVWPPTPAATNTDANSEPRKESPKTRGKTANTDTAIATVQGKDIPRSAIVDLLLKSHGAGLLEQMIGLEVVSQAAAKEGVELSEADVAAEYERALRKLMNPEGAASPDAPFDKAEAEKALGFVLAERNISQDEFMVTLRRNACLRKIVEKDLMITEEMIRDEYARTYGERVRVRHIQVSSLADADRILQRLASGEKFEDIATHESVNSISARRGGLLPPFSMADDSTPEAMRRAAFALKTGKVSSPIRAGQWYQILKLEERIPAESPDMATVHDALERNLRERMIETRTRALYDKLVAQVNVTILDPVLKEAYERRNPPAPK